MILDTTFIVDILRDDRVAHSMRAELEGGSEPLRVPAPVLFELWEGIERARNPPRERDIVEETLAAYATLPLSQEHAKRAGAVSAGLLRRGIRIGEIDLLIAGTALVEDDVVLTRNARDFERVPELRVRTY